LKCDVSSSTLADTISDKNTATWIPNWQQCDKLMLLNYRYRLDSLLHNVDVPWFLLDDQNVTCYKIAIDKFYNEVFSCISAAVHDAIPMRRSSYSHFNVPGWNTYVREKHDVAREAYLRWVRHGKTKMGVLFDNMKRTRAVFKLALRYCKNHVEEMKADACAGALMDKDCRKCWKCVYKISNSKDTNHVSSINGVSGTDDITNMWKDYFENIYSAKVDSKYRQLFENKLLNNLADTSAVLFTVYDVSSAINKQKFCKAAGPDGLQMEAFIYGCHRLHVYLTVLFNIFCEVWILTKWFLSCCHNSFSKKQKW